VEAHYVNQDFLKFPKAILEVNQEFPKVKVQGNKNQARKIYKLQDLDLKIDYTKMNLI
jgi:hypothetical protein